MMNPSQQHKHYGIVGAIIVILIILLVGVSVVIKRQWHAHESAPRIERERQLNNFKKARRKRADKNAQKKANKQQDAQETKQQKAIDNEANQSTSSKKKQHSQPKLKVVHKRMKHYISPNLLIRNQLKSDSRQDKSFTKHLIYVPKRNTLYVALNKHGLSLVHNKRWHKVAYRNMSKISNQTSQLRRINKHIHTKFVK